MTAKVPNGKTVVIHGQRLKPLNNKILYICIIVKKDTEIQKLKFKERNINKVHSSQF